MVVRRTRPRLCRVDAPLAVYLIQAFSRRIVRLHLVVRDRPGRRYATVMLELAEILPTKAEQGGAEELRVPADIVVRVRVQLGAGRSAPHFLRVVAALLVDREGAPVLDLAFDVIATL